MKLSTAITVVAAVMLAALAQAAPQARKQVGVSQTAAAPELLLARDSSTDTCVCSCVAASEFKSPCTGSCKVMACPLGKDDSGQTTYGKTCCMAETIDTTPGDMPTSDRVAVDDTTAREGDVAQVPVADEDDAAGAGSDSKLSPSSRRYRRYRCWFYYRTRCYCYNYRLGYRVYRRCRCFRFRYRRCRWVYY